MDDTTAKNTSIKTIEITAWKAVGILATSIVGTAITFTLATVRVLNSDHYTIISLSSRIDALERQTTPRGEVSLQFQSIDNRLSRIEDKLDSIRQYPQ